MRRFSLKRETVNQTEKWILPFVKADEMRVQARYSGASRLNGKDSYWLTSEDPHGKECAVHWAGTELV